MIYKHYANLDEGQTHYRRGGSGSPLVMLHASPMSSELMVPLIGTLLDVADVIAPDTPGYGNSDPLPVEVLDEHGDLTPYVNWLADFVDSLGLGNIGLYGTATGAQIAIEFARRYPEKLDYLILDNAAHFTDQERVDIMSQYFPDISARDDGSHLNDVWTMANGIFQWFPWYAQDEAHRISDTTPPTSAVHATALAYLAAGEQYAQAYRRAFANEDATRVATIKVPVRVIRWEGSVLKKYADRYDDFDWPDNIQMQHCGPSVLQRYSAIRDVVVEAGSAAASQGS